MKISPESFIENEESCLKYKSIFISGNDENYIYSLLNLLVSKFTKNGYVRKNLNENKDTSPDLFGLGISMSTPVIGIWGIKKLKKLKSAKMF